MSKGDWSIVELLKRGYPVRTTVFSLDKDRHSLCTD